jgi:hypothetical protein
LPPERIQRLAALGFEWDPFATDWQEGFAALEQFKAREGHCRVPVIHIEGNYGLGQWVSTQRKQIDSIPVERKQKLEALGLEWDPFESAWQQGFAMLAQFKAREGHCRVPEGQIEESFKLGNWVANQRIKSDSMTVEHRKRLDAMGFEWIPRASDWEEGFAALVGFKAREGHCCVPQSHIEKDCKLGQWVSGQRGQKDRIPVERRERLDALGFVWRDV